MRTRLGVLILLAAVSAALASTALSASAARPSSPSRIGGLIPPHHAGKQDNCPPTGCGNGQLRYHGGPTMTTNRVYTIFWLPSGQTMAPDYATRINQFFQDVSHDSGMPTNVYAAATQYSNILYSSTFGGTYTDTSAFPLIGHCTPYNGASACVSDQQVQAEVKKVISLEGWGINDFNLFFLFTPKNVESCYGTQCTFKTFCAYHSYVGGSFLYANMPYAVTTLPGYGDSCDEHQYPNGSDADSTINLISHEHNEAITDPRSSAWYDLAGQEDGDKCVWTFGSVSGANGAEYNTTINGRHYFLQEEFSNDSGSGGLCVQSHSIAGGGGGGPPQIQSFQPTSGPVGTNVDITGTAFTGATAVKFGGVAAAVFTVNSDVEVHATVPTGAQTGPIAITTPNGTGASGSSFTVTTGPPAPTVTSFQPTSGPVGTNVDVLGTGFTGATAVTFAGTAATTFNVDSDSELHATVPTGAATGKIAVTTPNGTGTSTGNFTVTTSGGGAPTVTGFTPTQGFPGAKVTIMGTNFTGATSVKLGSTAATFTVNSATSITATVPTEPFQGSYRWSVTTPGGTASSTSFFHYL